MNVLFLSYWGLNDGLTSATVFPHLTILAGFSNVEKIVLVTVEREKTFDRSALPLDAKILHVPLFADRKLPNVAGRMLDFLVFPKKLAALCRKEGIDRLIARGAPAGALAMKASRKTGLPFTVESFEPHAQYMLESGTWKTWDPRYVFQQKWEREQLNEAEALMPVTENYRLALIEKGVSAEKLDVIPCCVPLEVFAPNPAKREDIRSQLNAEGKIIGVYAGKFGGIYYQEEAFEIFSFAFDFFGKDFFLMILTPDDPEMVKAHCRKKELDMKRVFTAKVPYAKVPAYLSAADFAFSLQNPKPSNLYLSPVKNGEYWAAGLPVVLSDGVGDDHRLVLKEKAGALLKSVDKSELQQVFSRIDELLKEDGLKERMKQLSADHRNFSIARVVYEKWYG